MLGPVPRDLTIVLRACVQSALEPKRALAAFQLGSRLVVQNPGSHVYREVAHVPLAEPGTLRAEHEYFNNIEQPVLVFEPNSSDDVIELESSDEGEAPAPVEHVAGANVGDPDSDNDDDDDDAQFEGEFELGEEEAVFNVTFAMPPVYFRNPNVRIEDIRFINGSGMADGFNLPLVDAPEGVNLPIKWYDDERIRDDHRFPSVNINWPYNSLVPSFTASVRKFVEAVINVIDRIWVSMVAWRVTSSTAPLTWICPTDPPAPSASPSWAVVSTTLVTHTWSS